MEGSLMRITGLIATILMGIVPIFAQEEVLVSGKVSHGGFGGPAIKMTWMNGQPGFMTGGRAGWIINHTFVLGTANYNLLSNIDVPETGPAGGTYLAMEYSGLELEYIHKSDRLVHYSIHSLVAPGSVYLRDGNFNRSTSSDYIFVLEPSLSVTLNVVKFFRVSLSGSYRLVFDVESGGLTDQDLWGAGVALIFKFGKF
jgi:hypothetical protein